MADKKIIFHIDSIDWGEYKTDLSSDQTGWYRATVVGNDGKPISSREIQVNDLEGEAKAVYIECELIQLKYNIDSDVIKLDSTGESLEVSGATEGVKRLSLKFIDSTTQAVNKIELNATHIHVESQESQYISFTSYESDIRITTDYPPLTAISVSDTLYWDSNDSGKIKMRPPESAIANYMPPPVEGYPIQGQDDWLRTVVAGLRGNVDAILTALRAHYVIQP